MICRLYVVDASILRYQYGVIGLPDRAGTVGAPLVGAHGSKAATRAALTVGDMVGAFKSLFTVEYIRGVKENRWPAFDRRVWQRNYYEHIIRDEAELARVRRYIDENPLQWELDKENPQRVRPVGAPLVGARRGKVPAATGRPQGPPLRTLTINPSKTPGPFPDTAPDRRPSLRGL